jgi:hypothetical protein
MYLARQGSYGVRQKSRLSRQKKKGEVVGVPIGLKRKSLKAVAGGKPEVIRPSPD